MIIFGLSLLSDKWRYRDVASFFVQGVYDLVARNGKTQLEGLTRIMQTRQVQRKNTSHFILFKWMLINSKEG